jgi:hypothetical protein
VIKIKKMSGNRSQELEWAHVRRKGMGLVIIWPAFRSDLHIQMTTEHTWNSNSSVRSIMYENR